MIHKWSWGIAWTLFGVIQLGWTIPYLGVAIGIAFIVAGVSYILGK